MIRASNCLWAVIACACLAATAVAQEGDAAASPIEVEQTADDPMALQETGEATTEESAADESVTEEYEPGFWIFPSRPPLEGPISTDRAGLTDSYALVPRGYHHLEFGYTYAHDHENGTRTKNHLLGEFSLRTGLTDCFELRVKWAGYSLTETHYRTTSRWSGRNVTDTDDEDGGTDMSVGFKSPLLEQDGLIPNLSIIPAISLPTGSASKSTNDVDPSVELPWNYALTDKWGVYGMGVASYISDGDGRYFQAAAGSLATYYALADDLTGYLEYFGLYPSTRSTDCQHNVDGGFMYLINDNLQIDIRAGCGLNEEMPDFHVGTGLCIRF